MIRPVTCLCMMLSSVSGLYLYQVKHQARLLDREIDHTINQVKETRERTRMLDAEWTLLNEPGRLQDLAQHYLHLQPMAPAQFVQLSSLGDHLPAIQSTPEVKTDVTGPVTASASPASAGTDGDEGDSVIADADQAQAPVVAAAPVAPAHKSVPAVMAAVTPKAEPHLRKPAIVAPVHVASSEGHNDIRHETARPVEARLMTVRHDDRHVQVLTTRAVLTPKTAIIAKPLPLAVPRHLTHGGMLSTMNMPVASPAPSYVMHTMPVYASQPVPHTVQTAAYARPYSYGSALGMSGGNALPPPVPVAGMR